MQQLLSQLGIDWRLLISQAVDFSLILFVLWFFLYKPLLKLLKDRKERIEEGLMKAKMADERLHEIDIVRKEKIKEAEAQALEILRKTERDAKILEEKLLAKAKEKEAAELKDFSGILLAKEEASRRALDEESKKLIKTAIAKTVALSPELIDNALIEKAIKEAKQTI